ncbi:K(+)-transporting ATPase subunit C [Gloeocapsopsis dulcis]|uniref:K(+)-transporting ATPase subunit C n=1 Tax=Gloeocapsopsis dulcis TaxID=2859516 RepID=UPI00399BAD3E
MVRDIIRAIRITFVLWLLTAVIYPLIMIVIGQVFFPFQANGSIVQNLEGQDVGSALIGQAFTSDRYFQSRSSSVNYSSFTQQERDPENIGQRTGVSGASNFAPSNPDLLARINETASQLQESGISPTADLVYASGSGLDPHITVEAAFNQLERVAQARNLSPDEIAPLIVKHTQGRFLWIFGEPGVNVLNLNRELDVLQAPLE